MILRQIFTTRPSEINFLLRVAPRSVVLLEKVTEEQLNHTDVTRPEPAFSKYEKMKFYAMRMYVSTDDKLICDYIVLPNKETNKE